MKNAGKWLIILGAAGAIISIVAGVVLAVVGLRPVARMEQDAVAVDGPGNSVEQHFDKGREFTLYTRGANGVYIEDPPKCPVTGPAPLRRIEGSYSSITIGAQSRISFATYRVNQAGTYRIVCDRPGVTIASAVNPLGIMGGIGGGLLALFGGMLGVVMVALGIVLRVVGGRKATPPTGPPAAGSWPGADTPVPTPGPEA
ncbi:MAG: hypothetical protein QM728_01205 [Gordonia sp. (in: high G+C Gram-positive bacteria)]|uniref:hypothetical protein n=1 Tax=Gordonia sp. (in: high G+C Gram-positive bacteria) TaxID=84139 RepID=UPI0039E258B4